MRELLLEILLAIIGALMLDSRYVHLLFTMPFATSARLVVCY